MISFPEKPSVGSDSAGLLKKLSFDEEAQLLLYARRLGQSAEEGGYPPGEERDKKEAAVIQAAPQLLPLSPEENRQLNAGILLPGVRERLIKLLEQDLREQIQIDS